MKEASVLRRFENLIRARSGLNMRAQEAPLLDKTLAVRMQAGRFSAPEPYLDWLDGDTKAAEAEWKHLFVLLTNQESYFFRDQGQLAVIREQVLPELIKRNSSTRTLRIWSAGCSTGEEVYSLAMMLDEVLPFREEWRVLILGTDLSQAALERARSGIYGAWSFRAFDAPLKERFFVARGNKWEVKPHLRRNVTFAPGNLLLDEFPSRAGEMHDMDLIVCRNVFIYFGREAVSCVLRKFTATLRPDGYLVTGHAELHDVPLDDLQVRTFPQTVIYQRTLGAPRENKRFSSPAPSSVAATSPAPLRPTISPLLGVPKASQNLARSSPPPAISEAAQVTIEAQILIHKGRFAAALTHLETLLEREPQHLGALCLAAQANANAGRLDEAETLCRQAVAVSPFAPLPYHLLARIAEERGDSQAAKVLLKKVIYLNPASVRSYLELSAIYTREGDHLRALQMRRTALGTLESLGNDNPLPADEYAVEAPLTVGELKRQLQTDAL